MSLLEHLRSNSRTPTEHATPTPVAPPPNGDSQGQPVERLVAAVGPPPAEPPRPRVVQRNEVMTEIKSRVHEELIHELDPNQLADDVSFTSPARRAVEQAAEERIALIDSTLGRQERLRIASEIADEVLGLGPLEPLLRDPTITEVMVNAWDRVYFE